MRILFLQKRILFPADVGNKIRTLNIIRHLARWHDVTFLCSVQSGEEQYVQDMHELGVQLVTVPWRETPRGSLRFFGELALNLFSGYPFNVNKDYDPRLRRRAAELLAEGSYDLLVCDFVQMARNVVGLDVPVSVLFQHNVEAEIFQRHARHDRGLLRRSYMRLQWKKMRRFEAEAGRRFETVIAVSERDREIFEREYDWRHVRVIDTAVDTEFFQPSGDETQPDRVVFVGSMDWLPNEGGVEFFVKDIWPEIRRRRPAATFQIVGRNPGPAVRRLAAASGVEVLGTVPDVRPYLAEAAVVVVPLLVGGGTRLKIYEAMAMQKPVVSTTLGAEGLDVRNGENIVLADCADEFAAAVLGLLEDPQRRARLAAAARRLVVTNYSSVAIARQFDEICRQTAEQAATRPAGDIATPADSTTTPAVTGSVASH